MSTLDRLLRAVAHGYAGPRVLRHYPVTAPAAGAEWSLTVPGEKVWAPLAVTFRLTTDSNVANRSPNLGYTDGTTRFVFTNVDVVQVASLTVDYSFGLDYNPAGNAAVGSSIAGCLPDAILPGGYTIGTTTAAVQTGDTYTRIIVTVEEMLNQPWDTAQWIADAEANREAFGQVFAQAERS